MNAAAVLRWEEKADFVIVGRNLMLKQEWDTKDKSGTEFCGLEGSLLVFIKIA